MSGMFENDKERNMREHMAGFPKRKAEEKKEIQRHIDFFNGPADQNRAMPNEPQQATPERNERRQAAGRRKPRMATATVIQPKNKKKKATIGTTSVSQARKRAAARGRSILLTEDDYENY